MKNPRNQRIFVAVVIVLAAVLSLSFLFAIRRDKLMIRGSSDHFVFYCHKAEARYIPKLTENMENAYIAGTTALNYKPGGKFTVTIYHDQKSLDEATGTSSRSAVSDDEGLSVYIDRNAGDEPYTNAAYEAVRCVLRRLQGKEPTDVLGCAIALSSTMQNTQALFTGLVPDQSPTLDSLFQDAPDMTLVGFRRSPQWQYDVLFASFASTLNNNRGLGLLLRDSPQPNFSQATGLDKDTLNGLWRQWLINKGQPTQS